MAVKEEGRREEEERGEKIGATSGGLGGSILGLNERLEVERASDVVIREQHNHNDGSHLNDHRHRLHPRKPIPFLSNSPRAGEKGK
jgi:ssDNA-binding replication factor A large subunit